MQRSNPGSFGNELIPMKMEYGCTIVGFVLSFVLIMKNGSTVSVSIIDRNNTVFENRNLALSKHMLSISSVNGSECCEKDCIITKSGLEITTNCDGAGCQCIPYEQILEQTTKLSICQNKLVAIGNGSFEMFADLEVYCCWTTTLFELYKLKHLSVWKSYSFSIYLIIQLWSPYRTILSVLFIASRH